VLAFGIIENGRLMAIFGKDEGCVAFDHLRGSYTSPHECFLSIDHILGQKFVGVSHGFY
jgi:hypothetical protein